MFRPAHRKHNSPANGNGKASIVMPGNSSPKRPEYKLFCGLTALQTDFLMKEGKLQTVTRGSFLVHEGEHSENFYLLVHGRVKIYHTLPDGQVVLLRFALPGEVFGYWAFLPVPREAASAQAVEESRVVCWDRKAAGHIIYNNPTVGLNLLEILADHLDDLCKRHMYLVTQRTENRIAWALLALQQQSSQSTRTMILIPKGLSQRDLAEMAGTTIYTVSRTLRSWQQQGILTKRYRQIALHRPEELVALASQ